MELFKKQNDGLGNLSVSPCPKSRNGGRVIWEHRRGEHKTLPYSSVIAPTKSEVGFIVRLADCELKCA
jgi:hypothetical protein